MLAKVCILTSVHPPFDTRIFHKEAKSLAMAGYNVVLIAQHDKDEIVDGVRVVPLPKPKGRIVRMTRTVWTAYRKALKIDADIYHFHDPELIPIGLLLKLKGKKVVYDVHENYVTAIKQNLSLGKFVRWLISWIYGPFENLATCCFEIILAERYYQERFPGKTLVLNYPKDLHKITYRNTDGEDSNALLYTGSVSEDRGALIYASIVREMSEIEVYIVGRCPEELAQKMKKIAGTGVSRLHIEGINRYIPFTRICEYYKKGGWLAGIAIFPPTPNNSKKELTKLFEYMAIGLPIICSNFPVWKTLLAEANAGLLVDPENLNSIIDEIRWLKAHPNERRHMGENGCRAVEQRYNWGREEKKMLELYKKILK